MNSENSSSFTTVLKYYDLVKTTIMSFVSTFLANGSNKFYVRLAVMFGTLVTFMTRIVTATMLNYVYCLNNLVNTVKHLTKYSKETESDEQRSEQLKSSESMLNSWVTLSSVVMLSKLLDFVANFCQISLVSFLCEVGKYFVYYKLLSDSAMSHQANDKLLTVYSNNKAGVDSVQVMGSQVVSVVVDSFGKESQNDIILAVKKLKRS